jgi:hypothetical protein
MIEATLLREIQLEIGGRDDSRLWRAQSGTFELKDGRYVTVGFPGLSDLIGLKSITITPDILEAEQGSIAIRSSHGAAFSCGMSSDWSAAYLLMQSADSAAAAAVSPARSGVDRSPDAGEGSGAPG